jgi:GDP-L-fucose synthase
VAITQLVTQIAALTGFQGVIKWDRTKPDGQPRRALNVERARAQFGFQSTTPLTVGLERTIGWYKVNRSRV